MTTFETIQNDIKSAMKAGDTARRDVLRTLVSDIKNQTVNAGKEITEDIVIKCIQKSVKQHNDSIDQFQSANRSDLASKEVLERDILNSYLPEMATEEEIKTLIDGMTQSIQPIKKNMGLFMKGLSSPTIDKKIASKYLNQILK